MVYVCARVYIVKAPVPAHVEAKSQLQASSLLLSPFLPRPLHETGSGAHYGDRTSLEHTEIPLLSVPQVLRLKVCTTTPACTFLGGNLLTTLAGVQVHTAIPSFLSGC